MKRIFNKAKLVDLVSILYLLSILLDLHIFYNNIATLIRVFFISFIFIIVFIKYANKKDRIFLLAYFLAVLLYVILHLINITNFDSFVSVSIIKEVIYFVKISIHILIIFNVYKLSINKDRFYNLIELSTLVISLIIILTNIFKLGYNSYDFNGINFNIFEWFYKDINFLTASSKGYFHLTNQISAILTLYLPLLFIKLNIKFNKKTITSIFSTIISLFMLGTRVSTYSVFMILIIVLIAHILTESVRKNISRKFMLTIIVLLTFSYVIYDYCPLISRNELYSNIFNEEELSDVNNDLSDIISSPENDKNDQELKDELAKNYIKAEFYEQYYPLEKDREFYQEYLKIDTFKIRDTRFLERSVIKRIKSLNNSKYDDYFGIGYDRIMNIFNIENDFIMQYYSIGILGCILFLGVYVFLLVYMYFKTLFNLKRYFTYENGVLLFASTYFLICSIFTGNILNAISTIIPISFVLGYHLSIMNKKNNKNYEYVLGFKTNLDSKENIIKEIFESKKQVIVYNINPLILMNFYKDKNIINEFNSQEFNIPDGNGVVLTSKMTSGNIKKSIPGIEVMMNICEKSKSKNYKVYLYGASEDSVVKTKDKLLKDGVNVVGYINGYTKEEVVINDILKNKPDILFVALGSPLQEQFIINNKKRFKDIKIIMPVGGSFDVISGNLSRAPKIYRKLKIEWLYRMIKEPKRFKQIFGLIKFVILVLFSGFWYNEKDERIIYEENN